jgi:hypothetical protein
VIPKANETLKLQSFSAISFSLERALKFRNLQTKAEGF